MNNNFRNNDQGAVALITTVIMSILLTIVATGLITLMASESRQASDAEQSVRAFYAAESGVEDGVQHVIDDLAHNTRNQQLCASKTSIVGTIPVGWTCQSISYTGSPENNLDTDVAQTVDLIGAPPFDRMILSWDTQLRSGDYNMPTNPLPSSWSVPAIEMAFIDYQRVGNYTSGQAAQDDIKLQNVLAIPSTALPQVKTVNLSSPPSSNPYPGYCFSVAATGYHCTITVSGLDPSRYYMIRLRSKYQSSNFKLNFFSGLAPVDVPDGSATIDVTAKAGNVFRRVIYKVPIVNNAVAGLDYVLFSDNNICKQYMFVANDEHNYPCSMN